MFPPYGPPAAAGDGHRERLRWGERRFPSPVATGEGEGGGRRLGPISAALCSVQMHEQHRDVGGRDAGDARCLADRGRAKATELLLRFRA